ncbi:hypothetical protein [Nakamurella endophytica]|uniref:Uncharacterized protein n=1 Tax=Nakamurella endophytica TaxID=1748367 RepID=A0A917WBL7_9ACTN|nr:hypothetical protein [Nakamurella endophytica]GGL91914.1 hypothetical protein GCM10011594_09640 [Nakamurella endophytica]
MLLTVSAAPPGSAPEADGPTAPGIVGEYCEAGSGRRVLVARPGEQPALWAAYLDGALRSYRSHGVESVIEYPAVRDGRSTSLFVTAVEPDGRVVAGLRAHGPLVAPDQAHAVREWDGRPGTAEIRAQIGDRLAAGVVEIKAVWVDADAAGRLALTAAMARAFVHVMDVLQVRYALCTAARHAVGRWQSSGGIVSSTVPAVPYPDERYRTVLMWWDRTAVAEVVAAADHEALLQESDDLFGRVPAAGSFPSVA